MNNIRSSLLLLVICAGCGSQLARGPTAQPSVASATIRSSNRVHPTASGATYAIPESLVSLNELFLDGYKTRQAFVKTNTSPLIVADISSLILYWRGLTETNPCIPDIYHALKAVAHVPFGIFLRVDGYADETGSVVADSILGELRAYPARIMEAEAPLEEAGFSA